MSYTKLRNTLAGALATVYQMPEEDIANILPESEEEFSESDFKSNFLDLDKQRIVTIKEKGKEKFEQGYSKAKKEVLSSYENEIRDTYGIDDDELIGIDLVNKVVEINSKKAKGDPSKLSEEEIKKHPAVINLLSDREKAFKQKEADLQKEFDTKLQTINKERTFNSASKKALAILDSMKPVLSSDPNRAANQKSILLKELEGFEYQANGDEFIPLKDGKRYEDDHGNGVNFEQLVKRTAERYFDFQKADQRDTPPAGGDDGGGGGSNLKPKNEAEYAKIMTDKSIPLEEKQKVKEEWNKAMS